MELVAGPGPMSFSLSHWDGDTFSYADAPELPELASSVVFSVDDSGVADGVTISAFDGDGLGTLERVVQ